MNGDTDKKLIGIFSNRAKLYRLKNRYGVGYFTIEIQGYEYFSVEERVGEPDNMVKCYAESNKLTLETEMEVEE